MGNGPEFFQTLMGRRYYESTMPRIADALERIATALEKNNQQAGHSALNSKKAALTVPSRVGQG